MRYKVDPRQNPLFDPYAPVFSDVAYQRIRAGWWHLFRHTILELMPVEALEKHFHPAIGRPTKELYSMAGLLLVKEFNNWTEEEAVDAYMFHAAIQYALNLPPAQQSLSLRTLERYVRLFRENDLAARVMHDVTTRLVEVLELDISRQRLDSTHINSDMAVFGGTRLMGVAIKRFLTQVKRHEPEEYAALPEAIRERYSPSAQRMFADVPKGERTRLRQQVAEDLHWLIERFSDDGRFKNRSTYKMLVRVFEERCEVVEEKVEIKKGIGGDVLQNTSDPEATYDGHKGAGYQAQLTETCSDENDVQLITSAIVQTAVDSDHESLEAVLEDLEEKGLLPDELEADTSYGRDENIQAAKKKGVDLQSPVPPGSGAPKDPYELGVDDFVFDPLKKTILRCPAGHKPMFSTHDPETDTTTTIMPSSACGGCLFGGECPIRKARGEFHLKVTGKRRRLDARRREQATTAFKENYAIRSGIEATNSSLKRRTGLARLRVRGLSAVRHAVCLRIAGWNILRAAAGMVEELRNRLLVSFQDAVRAFLGQMRLTEGLVASLTA